MSVDVFRLLEELNVSDAKGLEAATPDIGVANIL